MQSRSSRYPPHKGGSVKRKLGWIVLILFVILLGVGAWYALSILNFVDNIHKQGDDSMFQSVSKDDNTPKPPAWEGKERVNILLLGGDSRGLKKNEVPRSDSIMVASLDPVTKKAYLFSVLRDTYVDIPGHGRDRINAALAIGGENLAMKTVSDLLGIPVQYYVYTDFKGFIALVDAIGGIDFYVEKDMHYTDGEDDHVYDIDLKKGCQHLDGQTALEYVRFRHDAMSDFTRTERQRNFLKAVAKKLVTTSSLVKVPSIFKAVEPYVQTNLSLTDMWKLAGIGFASKAEGIVSEQLPPNELLRDEKVGGASVLGTDVPALQQYVQDTFNKTDGGSGTAAGSDGTAAGGSAGGAGSSADAGSSGAEAGGTAGGDGSASAGNAGGGGSTAADNGGASDSSGAEATTCGP